MHTNKEKGSVWMIVILVVLVVLAIVWARSGGETLETGDLTTEEGQDSEATQEGTSGTTGTTGTGGTGSGATSLPTMTAKGEYIIYYGTNGFSPANLTIQVSKSVHIVNNSNSAMLIVPVDKVNKPYVNFMQSKSVGKGGSFDYTFTAVGSYAYYNDNMDKHTGVITVR